jgi:hypothetical protein
MRRWRLRGWRRT